MLDQLIDLTKCFHNFR